MRVLLQRVLRASCTVDGKITGEIGKGYLLFLGIEESDSHSIADQMIEKIKNLRIFEDENGKINKNLEFVNGEILLVPQFTLYADCRKGNRPNFIGAASPAYANELFQYMLLMFRKKAVKVEAGVFGADMKIDLLNDGPFTLILDSETLNFKKDNS